MDDASAKNFEVIRSVMNEQAKALREMRERMVMLEGNVARLQAEILNTKQLAAHLNGRGMGSTVPDDGG